MKFEIVIQLQNIEVTNAIKRFEDVAKKQSLAFEQEQFNDWTNIHLGSDSLKNLTAFWRTISTSEEDCILKAKKSWVVVMRKNSNWNDYRLLAHFDRSEKTDSICDWNTH